MPLSKKGEKIRAAMHREYGTEKGEQVFHASRNKGTISGVESRQRRALEAFARTLKRQNRWGRQS
jgi:hypothetical protein